MHDPEFDAGGNRAGSQVSRETLRGVTGPHEESELYAAGSPLAVARAALVMLHGRGAGASDMLGLAEYLKTDGFAFLAPEAAGGTWYPQRFMAPLAANEPYLSSALAAVTATIARAGEAGLSGERLILLGFSQGACLALEYAARNPARYGGVVGLSGGLIGPDGPRAPCARGMEGVPVFLGCSDRDPHIPQYRVEEARRFLDACGARTTMRIYPGMGHTINEDEIEYVRQLMRDLQS